MMNISDWFFGPKGPVQDPPMCGTEPTPQTLERIRREKQLRDLYEKGCGGVWPPYAQPFPPLRPPLIAPSDPPQPFGVFVCGTGPMNPAAPFGSPQGFSK